MDLLKEYEFESLPYIDKEYDNPIVKSLIQSMISEEMRKFTPNESVYLAYLPYPELKFSSSVQLEFSRIKSGFKSSNEKLDMKRYTVEAPTGPLETDVQAWRSSIANAKAQFEHQETRLMNAEIVGDTICQKWLNYNKSLENTDKNLSNVIDSKKRKVAEVNVIRKLAQDKVATELQRINKRRQDSLNIQQQILSKCNEIIGSYPEAKRNSLFKVINTSDDNNDDRN